MSVLIKAPWLYFYGLRGRSVDYHKDTFGFLSICCLPSATEVKGMLFKAETFFKKRYIFIFMIWITTCLSRGNILVIRENPQTTLSTIFIGRTLNPDKMLITSIPLGCGTNISEEYLKISADETKTTWVIWVNRPYHLHHLSRWSLCQLSAPLFPFHSLFISTNPSCRVPFSLTDSFHSPGSQSLCSRSRNQCEEQINISKQRVTSPSWFWFFCCLSGSVSALHRIKKPEYDTSQIPVDRWGLTTDVPELYTCMSAPIYTQTHTFMANTFVTLMGCICLGRLPQTKVPEEQSQINTIFFIFFHCSVVSVTGHDRCQHIFFSTLDGFSP